MIPMLSRGTYEYIRRVSGLEKLWDEILHLHLSHPRISTLRDLRAPAYAGVFFCDEML
jgi:hypothetical protein